MGRTTYNCAGLRIGSAAPLAASADGGEPDIVFIEGEPREVLDERPPGEVVAERVVDGVPRYTFARCGDVVVARFFGLADFDIDTARGYVVSHPRPDADPAIIPILFTGTIVAYLLSVGGSLVLHASAVEVDGEAVAFIGYSGQGKTTVATLFCAAGYPLVTDDVLPVAADDRGHVSCAPGGVQLRVRPKAEAVIDHFTEEVPRGRTADGRHGVSPVLTRAARLPLRAAIVPQPDRERPHCEGRRLPAIEAMLALTRFQRIEGWKSEHELRAQFAMIARVASSVPVLTMRVPWGPPFRPGLVTEVLDALDACLVS
jgi:hypothetical protein